MHQDTILIVGSISSGPITKGSFRFDMPQISTS